MIHAILAIFMRFALTRVASIAPFDLHIYIYMYILYNWFRMFARLCFARVRSHRVDQGCVLDCSLQLYSAWMCVASVQRP